MTIVDTSVWIDYFAGTENPQTEWLDQNAGVIPIGMIDLILCEFLQGIRKDGDFVRAQRELAKFSLFTTGGAEFAVASASNYRSLRAHGYTPRKTIDCLIATFCLTEGHSLLHRDRDFDAFEKHLGLKIALASRQHPN